MLAASGILTQRGGATSHAAVVARGLGKPCVTGCETLRVDPVRKNFRSADLQIAEGDPVSIDGATGEVFAGLIPTVAPDLDRQTAVSTLMEWADAVCRTDCRVAHDGRPRGGLQVWANADYPRDARIARRFGARGIGLCRTEHMFFEADRLPKVHQMILNAVDAQERYRAVERAEEELTRRPADGSLQARLEEARRRRARSASVRRYEAALEELQAVQRRDFEELFEVMDGLPVIVRLIDPPLHEFLPRHDDLLAEVTVLETRIEAIRSKEGAGPDEEATLTALAAELDEKAPLLAAVRAMRESNPMLGMRGIRLGLCFPGIVKMQVRAIFEAACRKAEEGVVVRPEIMIPLTGHVNELAAARRMLEAVAQEVIEARGQGVSYAFGTMIEVPRSALTAADIAREAEFFSFGTNDLTQMTFGYSRDDAEGKFLRYYVESGILPENPFQVIDRDGVGRLVRMAVTEGWRTRGDLELGICGEHGGDPDSIAFCHEAGLDYVSCSPYRVMVARLAAAQAALGRIEWDR
jgi:pyruvate,orthophosphate dikinase